MLRETPTFQYFACPSVECGNHQTTMPDQPSSPTHSPEAAPAPANPGAALRKVVKQCFQCLGLDVRFASNVQRNYELEARQKQLETWRFVQRYQPVTILDIGANEGQFASLMRELNPQAKIYSFEPLGPCFDKLQRTLAHIGNATGFQLALGEEAGEVTMNLNEYSPSSSLLPISDLHVREAPQTAQTKTETVQMKRLDDALAGQTLTGPCFAKLDVQGFENRVIRGGAVTLSNVVAIVVECSSYSLYQGQGMFEDNYKLLRDLGFTYRGNVDQWLSKEDGRILQFDALFERT